MESTGHILQECPDVAPMKIYRQSEELGNSLVANYWSVLKEPTIPTQAGIRLPDISWNGPNAWVVDTTICADEHSANLDHVFLRKVSYYDTEDIKNLGGQCPYFGACVQLPRGSVGALPFDATGFWFDSKYKAVRGVDGGKLNNIKVLQAGLGPLGIGCHSALGLGA